MSIIRRVTTQLLPLTVLGTGFSCLLVTDENLSRGVIVGESKEDNKSMGQGKDPGDPQETSSTAFKCMKTIKCNQRVRQGAKGDSSSYPERTVVAPHLCPDSVCHHLLRTRLSPSVVQLHATQLLEGLSPVNGAWGRPPLPTLPFPLHLHSCSGKVGFFSFLMALVMCKPVLFAIKAPLTLKSLYFGVWQQVHSTQISLKSQTKYLPSWCSQ